MPTRKFKFVSPGIFLDEVDNSQLPAIPRAIGPVIVGRTERGPAMEPVEVKSYSDFVEIFGYPVPGGAGGDVWRDGNKVSPTYAAYAAQAYLRNNSPVTMIRLLGAQHDSATEAGRAGFKIGEDLAASTGTGGDGLGGAFGLWVFNATDGGAATSGTLAAVWYLQTGSIALNGQMRGTSTVVSGAAVMVDSVGQHQYEAIVYNADGSRAYQTSFNLDRDSSKFVRKVFNTNPALMNEAITTSENREIYFLGETYESAVENVITSSTTHAVIVGMGQQDGSGMEHQNFKYPTRASNTGWFISQDRRSSTPATANSYNPSDAGMSTKLFRFISLKTGQWDQQNIKISIQDIKTSTNSYDNHGTFTVAIRKMTDNDNAPQIIERFTGCNLNPNSPSYIAKKIGDKYKVWDNNERRFREYGNFDNMSKFIRVEMNPSVENGSVEDTLLPFGVFGPPKFNDFKFTSGSYDLRIPLGSTPADTMNEGYMKSLSAATTREIPHVYKPLHTRDMGIVCVGSASLWAHCTFPEISLRTSATAGNLPSPSMAYWGASTTKASAPTVHDPAIADLVKAKPGNGNDATYTDTSLATTSRGTTAVSGTVVPMWIFTLHDVSGTLASGSTSEYSDASYVSGSYRNGSSISGLSSTGYQATLNAGFDRFTTVLYGGFDGLDITEQEPFANRILGANSGETTNYAFYSVKRAVDSLRDPESVEFNAAAMPGITNPGLTTHLINVCEERADALAIVDLEGDYSPPSENSNGDSDTTNRGDIDTTISNLASRGLNSSYACCFYPWVQIRDTTTGQLVWVPPSIAALGTFGSTERRSEVWFAPAGFTRGGLSQGAAGLPVVGVKQRLTSTDRDRLYSANINPIASFPSEGIVIFGQKTLQVTPSALDRINVRRLMIYVKKEISRMAATILFDQNVETTWNGFLGRVEPFLRSVKSRLGLTDFKVILDETTTTPDLVDRNILYAKVFLKPARAIEFIAIDFVITDSGAAFED